MQDEYIDLTRIIEIIKKKLLIFIAIIFISIITAFGYTKLGIEKTYTATATVIIVQKNENVVNNPVTMSDVQLSQKLVNTYKQIIMSEAISDQVLKNLNLNELTSKDYKDLVKVSSANETEVMNISATTNNPELSAKVANEIVKVFQEKIYDILQVENVSILNNAKVPISASGPNTIKNIILGMLIGIVICILVGLYEFLTDTKIKTEEEVKKILEYPIIGIIPEFETDGGEENEKAK